MNWLQSEKLTDLLVKVTIVCILVAHTTFIIVMVK
jgi:hypothetical protein